MNNKKLAIVIELNGNLEKLARKVWKELDENISVNYISSKSPAPHITLVAGFYADLNKLKMGIINMSNNHKTFNIESNGLGVYLEKSPVVHIRWKMDFHLQNIVNSISTLLTELSARGYVYEYELDLAWEPKATLAYIDSDYDNLIQIINIIKKNNFKQLLNINGLSLYEYSKEEGERIIEKFYFG